MLTACGLIEDVLIAGYANGKTCLWNVESNWQSSLAASAEAIQNPSNASVECVTVLGNICAAAFSSGELCFVAPCNYPCVAFIYFIQLLVT